MLLFAATLYAIFHAVAGRRRFDAATCPCHVAARHDDASLSARLLKALRWYNIRLR